MKNLKETLHFSILLLGTAAVCLSCAEIGNIDAAQVDSINELQISAISDNTNNTPSLTKEPYFEINRILPPLSITKNQLNAVYTLHDLNMYYNASWVRKYISVEIITTHKGQQKITTGEDLVINNDQKEMLSTADIGSEISVNVKYIPENILSYFEEKEMNFSIIISPETNANFPGGMEKLRSYIQEKAITQIPEGSFTGYDLAAVKFTIDGSGHITNVHMFEPFKNDQINLLLKETISNMPHWNPATYSNGMNTSQEFVLTVGNMNNCNVNLLNIRRGC